MTSRQNVIGVTRRQAVVRGVLVEMTVLLSGCVTLPLSEAAISAPADTFASEPHQVRVVNRAKIAEELRPARLVNVQHLPAGSILVDTSAHQLFFAMNADEVLRYGIAVGAAGRSWRGSAVVGRKARWPAWYPTDEMKKDAPGIPARIPPGADNPLGARALYLYANGRDTLYRIHGTSEPWTIGTEASSGCIRMFNEDVIDIFHRVSLGARVEVK